MEYSVIVAHPGKQHSYRVASTMQKNGKLKCYITSVYNKPGHITHGLYKISRGNIKKKIGSHYITDIPQKKIKLFCESLGVFSLVSLKIPFLRKFYTNINNYLNDSFGKKTFKFIKKNKPDMVISYDYNSAILFERLASECPDVVRVLDVSIITRPFMQEIFRNDYEKTNERALVDNYAEIWSKESISRVYREINNADYFLAPSQIVKNSLIYCGVNEEKIKIVPYGTDCSKFEYKEKNVQEGPLKLIFVGAVEYRKGIHHLLNVISRFKVNEVTVKLVGAYNSEDSIYKNYHTAKNIQFCGFVTRDILATYYQEADVFVLPSLGEGMAMVIMEAMSCGLPVIVSDKTGGNDAIKNGVEGFEFEAGNDEQLYERIKWFIEHKGCILDMGKKAREKAEMYTWNQYGENLVKALDEIMEEKESENIDICNSGK